MNALNSYSKKLFLSGLLFLTLFATGARAQGEDYPVVIKKNISVTTDANPTPNGTTHYLAHVKVDGNWVLQDATAFNPETCLWYTGTKYNHTGRNHNYYFVDDNDKLHYLAAPMESSGALSLSDDKPAAYLLSNTDQDYYFYNWDGVGLARGHQVIGIANETQCDACGGHWSDDDGECWEVYWVEYDLTLPSAERIWKLTDAQSYSITYNAARAYEVTITEHPLEVTGTPTGGLTALTVPQSTMSYPSNQNPTATVNAYSYSYVPAYTTYSYSEITGERTSENPRTYATRSVNNWGGSNHGTSVPATATASGVAATQYEWTLTGEGAAYLSFASGSDVTTSTATAPTIYYRTENTTGHKTATLTLTVTFGTGATAVTMTETVDITVETRCQNPVQAAEPVVGYDYVTVSWTATAESYNVYWKTAGGSYGTPVTVSGATSYTITGIEYGTTYTYKVAAICESVEQSGATEYTFTTGAEPGVLVYGAVFGGGRMANVTGKTEVVIINCDTLGAVYGGNDIAGEVLGADGSTITLGVNAGDSYSTTYNAGAASTKVVIGSVYGGGNGYYTYDGNAPGVTIGTEVLTDRQFTSSATEVGGGDSYLASGYIPSIKKTSITVTSDAVKADSVFGGAKNAFINNTSGDNTTIAINGGTIFSVFGGNNYGGTLGAGSNQHITLAGTKTNLTDAARGPQNTYTTGFGRDFGIRYLFGGGNKVAGRNVIINVTGGQTDTLFGGGNAADVASVLVTVNCPMSSGTAPTWGSTYSDAIESYSGAPTVKELGDYAWNGSGLYNVRTLFGGNNAAAMSGLPTVTLTSGSAGTVYGGGNAGDMNAKTTDDGTITADFDGQLLGGVEQTIYYGTHVEMNSADMVVDYIYGGCQKSSVKHSTWVEMKNGNAGTVLGGCNISGDVGSLPVNPEGSYPEKNQYVNGATYVKVSGGTVHGDVFAGSNGRYHCNDAVHYVEGINYTAYNYVSLTIPTHNETHVLVSDDITVKGNVYAGGNMAPVGFSSASRQDKYNTYVGFASVKMTGGTVNGDVYGGGKMASVYGSNEVQVSGGAIGGALYGGNDIAGQVAQVSNRKLPDGYGVASDGQTDLNALNVNTYVSVTGRPDINTVYGGGNGAYDYENMTDELCDITDKPIQTVTFVDINIDGFKSDPSGPDDGGHIANVYGGGNGVTVTGGITVLVNVKGDGGSVPEAYDHVGTIFGGNNMGDLAIVPDIILLQGQANTVYGGCNQGAMTGSTTVTADNGDSYSNVGSLVRLRDEYLAPGSNTPQSCENGKVSGAVYGGCRMNGVTNNTLILVEGGTHTCDLFGGSDISGQISGLSQVVVNAGSVANAYGGGNGNYYYDGTSVYQAGDHSVLVATSTSTITTPSSNNTNVIITDGSAANLFGGGKAAGAENTTITVDGGTVTTGIYGGSESMGDISGDVTININAGTVGASGTPADGVFGGGYGAATTTAGNVTVNIGLESATGASDPRPTLYADVYGGSALGTVNDGTSDLTTVNIINGTVNGNVYGGGLGAATLDGNGYIASVEQSAVVNGNVQVNVGLPTQTTELANGYYNYVTINGSVFGCNNLAGSPLGTVNVDVYHTAHTSDNAYPSPEPTGSDDIPAQTAYAIYQVYGGGNLAAYAPTVAGAPAVYIHNCDNTIQYVYGGGNAAVVPETDVTVDGGRFDYVFAGGNGAGTGNPGADITGDANLTINGGIISNVFGGSNTKGVIGGDKNISVTSGSSCIDPTVENFYGGGNRAPGTGGTIEITNCNFRVANFYGGANAAATTGDVISNIYGGTYDNIFGGSNAADITGNVVVNFYGGTVNNIFGGNNTSGQISGTIVVNVIKNEKYCTAFSIGNVYGGGNNAAYGDGSTNHGNYPQVNILHTGASQVNYDVFGGGLGTTAQVYGDPQVTIGGAENITIEGTPVTRSVTVGRNVYGGGSAAQVNGSTKVLVIGASTIDGNVYGGGNEAAVTGSTDVQIGD